MSNFTDKNTHLIKEGLDDIILYNEHFIIRNQPKLEIRSSLARLSNKLDEILKIIDTRTIMNAVLSEKSDSYKAAHLKVDIVDRLKNESIDLKTFVNIEVSLYDAQMLVDVGIDPYVVIMQLLDEKNNWNQTELDIAAQTVSNIIQLKNCSKSLIVHQDNHLSIDINFPSDFISYLGHNFMSPTVIISTLINQDVSEEMQDKLDNHIDVLSEHKIDYNKIIQDAIEFKLMRLSSKTLNTIVNKGVDIKSLIYQVLKDGYYSSVFNQLGNRGCKAMIDILIEQGHSINTIFPNQQTLLEMSVINHHSKELIAHLINYHADVKIPTKSYLEGIISPFTISNFTFMLNNFDAPDDDSITKQMRFDGVSHEDIKLFIDFHNLAKTYVASVNDNSKLHEIDFKILDRNYEVTLKDLEDYVNVKNEFSLLQMLLFSNRLDVAYQLMNRDGIPDSNKDDYQKTIYILINVLKQSQDGPNRYDVNNIRQYVINHLNDVDVINDTGGSILDSFMRDPKIKAVALLKTKDPLYQFLKPDVIFEDFEFDNSKAHIAISYSNHLWSDSIFSFSRLAMKDNNVAFHIVEMDMLQKGGDKFIQQFDGWINPGAGDSYPQDMLLFNKSHWEASLDNEEIYQYVLDKIHKFNIPYLGICAGAQHLVLYHDGYLQPSPKTISHHIKLIKGTLSHFQSMTETQKYTSLKTCDFPSIEFIGQRAHNYAAVVTKLGDGIKLGGFSGDGMAMLYAHDNGIEYGSQFHPENSYSEHQKEFLDSFINLAIMHKEMSNNSTIDPVEYMKMISDNLHQCIESKICPKYSALEISENPELYNNLKISEIHNYDNFNL